MADGLFANDLHRLERGIGERAANAALMKPNQAGTLTAAADVLEQAQSAGLTTVVSARSGETQYSWLADLAVGWAGGQVKAGSTTRSERNTKWNRLLLIERIFGANVQYAGPEMLKGLNTRNG